MTIRNLGATALLILFTAFAVQAQTQFTSTYAGGNGIGTDEGVEYGAFFDVRAINEITITSFDDVHLCASTGSYDIDVLAVKGGGSYQPHVNDPSVFTPVASTTGVVGQSTSRTDDVRTSTPGLNALVVIPAGTTQGFYYRLTYTGDITAGCDLALIYTNGTTEGTVLAADANVEFLEGRSTRGDLTVTTDQYSPRNWNGTFTYGLGALPVELTAFDAVADGSTVRLSWATASETNNAGFDVEQRIGETWTNLGFVEGAGSTSTEQAYGFTVRDLAPGGHAFRLRQVDFDGAFEYSAEVEATVAVEGTHALTAAYPNPVRGRSTFEISAGQTQVVTATLYNMLGQRLATLYEGTAEANTPMAVTVDAADLASGVYFVRVRGEHFSDVVRVVVQK